jgi:Ca-activated chloride channel homolog
MRVAPRSGPLAATLAFLLGFASGAGCSQEPPPADTFQDEVSVGLVLVPVVVRSGGGYAKSLDQDDFRLLIDGKAAKIESFERRSDAPASILVLQDVSGSMEGERIRMSREAVRFFLDKALAGDEFAISTFAGEMFQVDVPFTANIGTVREAVTAWEAYGTTALHDAVARMPQISLEGRNPKRFALLITDGVDNASRLTPEQARAIVQEAQLPTYVLGLGSGNPYELSEKGEKIYRYADVLSLLAAVTGGRYYSIQSSEQLQEALTAILDDVRHQYVLGFSTGDGAVKFRPLKVEVKGKNRGQTVVFRRGYKGTPPVEARAGG